MEKEETVCVCVCVCTHNGILAIKMNEIMLFAAAWVNLEIIIVTEVSQIKTANQDIYMCSLKEIGQVNLLTKQKWLIDIENKLTVTRGKRGNVINREFWIDIYTLLYIK